MIKTVKVGGSSLADANQFRKVEKIIKSEPSRRYVVASAPGKRFPGDEKVTDLLIQCHHAVKPGGDISGLFEKVENRFRDIINGLGLELSLESQFANIKQNILGCVGADYVISRGEYLNSIILANFLGFEFVDAADVIFFSEDGTLDAEKTNSVLGAVLSKKEYALVPGFYGSMPNGTIKTFSRGGSDITGSIVARAVKADIYENWTDVSGMLMADPRYVPSPEPIKTITYHELRELAYMGASVMHEDAIFPVRRAGIPINIKNTNKPEDPGTMIVRTTNEPTEHIITGIAGKTGFSAIYIEKAMMNSELGFGRKVLEIFENHHISFEHLPSGIDTMSVVVESSCIADLRRNLLDDLCRIVKPDALTIHDDLALIAVVGRGMVQAQGTALKIFVALSSQHINIRMIDQGSSELNIIVGINASDYENALKAIYDEFVKN